MYFWFFLFFLLTFENSFFFLIIFVLFVFLLISVTFLKKFHNIVDIFLCFVCLFFSFIYVYDSNGDKNVSCLKIKTLKKVTFGSPNMLFQETKTQKNYVIAR